MLDQRLNIGKKSFTKLSLFIIIISTFLFVTYCFSLVSGDVQIEKTGMIQYEPSILGNIWSKKIIIRNQEQEDYLPVKITIPENLRDIELYLQVTPDMRKRITDDAIYSFHVQDTDNNGEYDTVKWVVPELSETTFFIEGRIIDQSITTSSEETTTTKEIISDLVELCNKQTTNCMISCESCPSSGYEYCEYSFDSICNEKLEKYNRKTSGRLLPGEEIPWLSCGSRGQCILFGKPIEDVTTTTILNEKNNWIQKMKNKGLELNIESIGSNRYNLLLKKQKVEVLFKSFQQNYVDWNRSVDLPQNYNRSQIEKFIPSKMIIKDFVWVDTDGFIEEGEYSGNINLPRVYSFVFVCEGTKDTPYCYEIQNCGQNPCFTIENGKTIIHLDHFSGGGGADPTNQYNQDGNPYIANGTWVSGSSNNLNTLGEGSTFDVQEQAFVGPSSDWKIRGEWGTAYDVCVKEGSVYCWSYVSFNHTFNTTPVVVAEANYDSFNYGTTAANTIPVKARVTNVTKTGFYIRAESMDDDSPSENNEPPNATIDVYWLAMEQGIYNISNNGTAIRTVEVGNFTAADAYCVYKSSPGYYNANNNRNFQYSWTNRPLLFVATQTMNNGDDVELALKFVHQCGSTIGTAYDNSCFNTGLSGLENSGICTEITTDEEGGYIAMEMGTGYSSETRYTYTVGNDSLKYQMEMFWENDNVGGLDDDLWQASSYSAALSQAWSNGWAIISQTEADGADGSFASEGVAYTPGDSNIHFLIIEDGTDNEKSHRGWEPALALFFNDSSGFIWSDEEESGPDNYIIDIWHNSTQIDFTGELVSINVTLNFTTNVSDTYSLQIYDWENSLWDSNGCDSGIVNANTPTQWWCNVTTNPMNYNSSDGIVRIRINSTLDEDIGLLKEDYVQFYISYMNYPPSWQENYTSVPSGSEYSPGRNYGFEIKWIDLDQGDGVDTAIFEWDNINYTQEVQNIGDTYWINFTDLSAGNYNFKWYANDTNGFWNFTNYTWTYSVVQNTTNPVNLVFRNSTGEFFNQNMTINYEELINATGLLIYPNSGLISLYRDGINIDSENSTNVLLGVNTNGYEYKVNITGNANYTSNSTGAIYYLFINKKQTTAYLWINDTRANIGFTQGDYANFTLELVGYPTRQIGLWTNYSDGTWKLWDDGTSPLENITQFTNIGIFNFTANYTGNENYTESFESWLVTVSFLSLESKLESLSPTIINQDQNTTVTGNCSVTGGTVNNVFMEVQSDGIAIPNISGGSLQVNGSNAYFIGSLTDDWKTVTWNITGYDSSIYEIRIKCNSSQTGASFSSSQSLQVNDVIYPQWSENKTFPPTLINYLPGQTYQFNSTWTDNSDISEVIFEFDGQNYSYLNGDITKQLNEYYITFTDLSAGDYNFRWYGNDTSDNWNISDEWTYQIQKSSTNITLLLNSTRGNRVYEKGEIANITATLNASDKTLFIYANYTGMLEEIASDTNLVTNLTDTGNLDFGNYLIKANWTGDNNFTSDYEQWILTVNDSLLPQIFNITSTPQILGYGFNTTISADVTDNVNIDSVLISLTYPNSTPASFELKNSFGNLWQYNFSDTWQWGDYTYWIWANDTKRNVNDTSLTPQTFSVKANATIAIETQDDIYGPNKDIEIGGESWWDSDWVYRIKLNITELSNEDLNEYQILVVLNESNFNFSNAKSNGEDIRVINSTGNELYFYFDSWECCYDYSNETYLWVKLPNLPSSSTEVIYIYYGHSQATQSNYYDEAEVFSYSKETAIFYPVGSNNADTADVISFRNSNNVTVGTTTRQLNERQTSTLPDSDMEQYSPISILKPVQIDSQSTGDAMVPISFASDTFVYRLDRGTNTLYYYAPFGDAEVQTCYGTNFGTCLSNVTVSNGTVGNTGTDTPDDVAVRIISNVTILAFHQGAGNDNHVLYPASKDWWGVPSRFLQLAALYDDTHVEVYYSDGSSFNTTLDEGGQYYSANLGGAEGETIAAHIISDKPIGASQIADADGSETTTFLPEHELGKEYYLPQDSQYISIATTQPATNCTLYNGSYNIVSQTSNSHSRPRPNKIYFGDPGDGGGTTETVLNILSDSKLVCNASVFAYYEPILTNDEHNLWSMKSQRKYQIPHPQLSFGNEESGANASIQNTGFTNISAYLLMQVETNTSGYWKLVSTQINDSNDNEKRTILSGEKLDITKIWDTNPWNTDSVNSGYYRVNVTLTDKKGSPLINDSQNEITDVTVFYVDIVSPQWYNLDADDYNPIPNEYVDFSALWSDNGELDTWRFQWNATTGFVWEDAGSGSFSGNPDWSNITKQIPTLVEAKVIGFRFIVNDTEGSFNTTDVYTLTVQDVTPPSIGGESIVPSIIHRNETVNITATITDNVGVNLSWSRIGIPNNGYVNISMDNLSGDIYNLTYLSIEIGEYNITIYANDSASYENSGSFNTWTSYGYSNVTWISPNGGSYPVGSLIKLTCFVSDVNTSSPIQDYPVTFWNETTLLYTNYTNSTGHAVYYWDTGGLSKGTYTVNCTIKDNSTLYYTADSNITNTTISILVPEVNLTEIKHENEYDYSINEYETGDTIQWINVTVNNTGGATSLSTNITLNVLDESNTIVSWFSTQKDNCDDLTSGEICEKEFSSETIPTTESAGVYKWNVTTEWDGGGTPPIMNSSITFRIHHIPDNISSIIDPEKIIQNESSLYNFTLENPWSASLNDVNATINCPDENMTCVCLGTSLPYCILGDISSGNNVTVSFNISSNSSTKPANYNINVTLNYTNPGGEFKSWIDQANQILELRGPTELRVIIITYPLSITRDSLTDLRGFVNNTGLDITNNVWLNWTLPSYWINQTGNLTNFKSSMGSYEIFWNNITANLSIESELGEQYLELRSESIEESDDWDTVSISVYANTSLNYTSINNNNPFRNESVIFEAQLIYDNESALVGETVSFMDIEDGFELGSNTTNSTGHVVLYINIPYDISLGSHTLNVTYGGSDSIYTNPVWNDSVTYAVYDQITIENVSETPETLGYGFNVTIISDIFSRVSPSVVRANISSSDSWEWLYLNYNGTDYAGIFTNTWTWGTYSYYIWANNTAGFTNDTSLTPQTFSVKANATLKLSTEYNVYAPDQDVNLTSNEGLWWNSNWLKRRNITIDNTGNSDDLFDYQIFINVSWNENMDSTFGDLRFTWYNDTSLYEQEINYWIEQNITSGYALVWLKVPEITGNSYETLYMYYNNSGVTSTSNGTKTWIFFDDFEPFSGWNDIPTGGTIVLDTTTFGYPVMNKSSNCDPDGGYKSLGTTLSTFRMLTREYRYAENSGCGASRYGIEEGGTWNGYTMYRTSYTTDTGTFGFERRTGGSGSDTQSTTLTQPYENWYIIQMTRDSNSYLISTLHDEKHNYIGENGGTDSTFTSFDTFTVRGGEPYAFDWIAVGNYTTTEPTTSINSEESFERVSSLENIGAYNISGYMVMTIENNNTGDWQRISTQVNDTTSKIIRRINPYDNLELSEIWNPSFWNTDSFDSGYYRIYSNFTDPQGNVLRTDAGDDISNYTVFFVDTKSPQWTNLGTNNSYPRVNQNVKFYSYWTDNYNLNNWIFSWNVTVSGIWENVSSGEFSANADWSNTTQQIPSFATETYAYKFYGYDSSGNENVTSEGIISIAGYLEVYLVSPPDTIIIQNKTFSVNATAYCRDGFCGNVNGTVRYNETSDYPDTIVSTTQGTLPFYVHEMPAFSVKSCPGNPLSEGEFCNITWTINATGQPYNAWKLGVLFNSTLSNLPDNHTDNSTIDLIPCTNDFSLWPSNVVYFDMPLPNSFGNNATGNINNYYNISVNPDSCALDLYIKGTDLTNETSPYVIQVGNLSWNNYFDFDESIRMTYNYTLVNDTINENTNVTTYYWLDVPPVYAVAYSGTITICGNSTEDAMC